MAKDDYDIDWGADNMFDGDIDFDMEFDYDPYASKSFFSGLTSGFLSGIVDETVGSSSSRMRTMRTVLPSTFTTALDKVSFISGRMDELAKEFKEENAQTARSLQSIAGHLSNKMSGKLPGFLDKGLVNFSEKDFSSWEKIDDSDPKFTARQDDVTDEETDYALDRSLSAQSTMFGALGDSINSMTAAATASIHAVIGSGNRQLVNIEGGIRDLLHYQRNVQAKMDQAKLNLMARSYVQDAKYYKFMEAGIHAEVTELKRIVKNTGMSDFEKTSAYTASKQYMRNSLFNAAGKRLGGISGYVGDKLSKDSRTGAYGAIGDLVDNVAMGMDMGEGMMSKGLVGEILGKMVASVAVEQLPYFFTRGPGKKWVDTLMKKNPEQATWIRAQIKQLTDMGNVVSYAATSGMGMANYMADNYQPIDEMKFLDYDEYLQSLEPGQKPMNKTAWKAINGASNAMKTKINKVMSDVTKSRGTQYTIPTRNAKDLSKVGIWKEMNNITLNEVIPGLISNTNKILEQIRTGRDDVEKVGYNYMRGQFMTESERKVTTQADLMPHAEFKNFTTAALELVDGLDPDKLLSASTRKVLALQIAKDVDAKKGFNPFYYLGNIEGASPTQLKEIHAVMKRHFGIEDADVEKFKTGDALTQMKTMSYMPTEEGRSRLNTTSSAAANLMDNYPNVAERINLLRQTGNEQMLRDIGVIYTDNGIDKINMKIFHERMGAYMDNPNDPILKGVDPAKKTDHPTKGSLGGGSGTPPPVVTGGGNEELNSTLATLNERLASLADSAQPAKGTPPPPSVNFDTATGELTAIKDSNAGILTKSTEMLEVMSKLYDLAAAGRLMRGENTDKQDREEQKATRGIWNKIKDKFPKDLVTNGRELVMGNGPLILGGLLGGIGSSFVSNPIAAAGVAITGLLVGGMAQRWGKKDASTGGSTGDEPSDDEDIVGEDGEPLLHTAKLKAGVYIDAVTKRVIQTWSDIRGPVIDTATKAVIGARDLAGKIFGPDGRAVALRGLNAVKDAAGKLWDVTNPLGRAKSMLEMGKALVYQQDVYVKGDPEPRLLALKFKSGDYYIRETGDNFKPISGWNEINGAVYDDKGNQLVTEAEYESGLVTATGAAVRNMGGMASNLVGSAAGMAKAGFDAFMGKFGYNKGTTTAPPVNGPVAGTTGTDKRLDRIYKLLAQWSGITVEDPTIDTLGLGGLPASTGASSSTTGSPFRLNSLAFKRKEKEAEEKHKVNEAIIRIAENTEDLGGGDDKDKKEGGIFSKIKGFIGGIATFGMNLIKNPIGAIGNLIFGSLAASAGRLAKIGTALFSGILGAASPIYKLLKFGFNKIAQVLMLKKGMDGAEDLFGGGDPDQRGQGGRRDRRRRRGRRGRGGGGGRGSRFRFGNPLAMAAGAGASWLLGDSLSDEDDYETTPTSDSDISMGDRDPVTGHYRTMGDSAVDALTTWLPQGQLADALVSKANPEKIKTLNNYGLFWSSDGSFFFKRDEMEAQEDKIRGISKETDGYKVVDDDPADATTQKLIRMAMYGVVEPKSALGRRVMLLEKLFYPYIVIRNDRASLKPDTPTEQLLEQFANADTDKFEDKSAISGWFIARFKPIFLVFNAAVSVARMGDLNEFDKSKAYDVVQVVERVQQSISTLEPYPYNISARIDSKVGLMDDTQTRRYVGVLLEKLKKEIPAPSATVESIATSAETQKLTEVNAANAGKGLTAEMGAQDMMGAKAAQASQQAINDKFKQPEKVTEIGIADLLPGKDEPMDPFVMTRLAAYGNIDNMGWRVEAVLRLERYVENFIMVVGDDARFTGQSGLIFQLFKPSFRVVTDMAANNWMMWFRDRFLPVLMTFVKEVRKYKGGLPANSWKTLSATNRATIARKLTEQLVNVDDQQKTIWEIEASPFPNSKSGAWSDRADKYLAILDAKAQEARLKDPEKEDLNSAPVAEQDPAQKAQASNVKERTDAVMAQVYGKKFVTSGGGVGGSGATASSLGSGVGGGQGVYPNPTMSTPGGAPGSAGEFTGKANENFNPEFIKQAGEDKGVKMSLEQGEKLMLNHLVKAGFKDNKVLALALAMARKETGGYQNTVEDTRWSAPTLLKYFKNIPDAATAQKVAAMSPPERAMYVYGRAPKGPQLGNSKPEDGWDYRGRGFFQLTGKANYEQFKKETGIDVVKNPRLVSEDPNVMAESAVRFLKNNKAMLSIAKTGDFETAVRGINGGNAVPATDERRGFYNDYLNKLRSGDLNLGGEDPEGEDPAAAAPTTEAPSVPDKNVPDDHVDASKDIVAKPAGKTVTDLLNEADASKAPSTTASSSTAATASPLDAAAEGGAPSSAPSAPAASAPASTGKPGSTSSGTSNTAAAPATSTIPVVENVPINTASKERSSRSDIPAEVKMPDRMATSDSTVAGLLGEILGEIKAGNNKPPLVRM